MMKDISGMTEEQFQRYKERMMRGVLSVWIDAKGLKTAAGVKRRTAAVEKSIAALAESRGHHIVFHEYAKSRPPVSEPPHILVYMSASLGREVEKLDHVKAVTLPGYFTHPRGTAAQGGNLREVFEIAVDYNGLSGNGSAFRRLCEVQKSMTDLAQKEGIRLVFHKYAGEPDGGEPAEILAEMPVRFVEKLRGIDHVESVNRPFSQTEPQAPKPRARKRG